MLFIDFHHFFTEKKMSIMPYQDFTALTKELKRNLLDLKNRFVDVESHFKLTVISGQMNFKTSKHGKIDNLTVDKKSPLIL